MIIVRAEESPRSRTNLNFVGKDIAILTNTKTGESVYLSGGQTHTNHSKYPVTNTIKAFSGSITFQYLGDNKEGAILFNGSKSSYAGPILNITETTTEGFGEINGNAQLIGDTDTTPFRVHSDEKTDGTKVSKASGGCFIFSFDQLKKISEAFKVWGVKPGDTINGYVKQDFPQ